MGLTKEITRFILQSAAKGAPFGRVLTLGHQYTSVSPERLQQQLAEHGFWPPRCGEEEFRKHMADPVDRFEGLAHAMGASEVIACDASDYEGAQWTHDLNRPVPESWHNAFDVVLDSGTLEHVFNFPTAVANCMRAVRPGGRLFLFTPANNYFGHGFYQFSPELFYRVLSPENGFRVDRMWLRANAEGSSNFLGVQYPFPITTEAWEVRDPAAIHERVTLVNDVPVLLFIEATKERDVVPFQRTPQQSDYVEQWGEEPEGNAAKSPGATTQPPAKPDAESRSPAPAKGGLATYLQQRLPESVCREWLPRVAGLIDWFRLARFRKLHSTANRRFYSPADRDPS